MLIRALASIRLQPTLFPAYSHDTYNVDPALARSLPPGGIVLIEGLGLPPPGSRQSLDLLIYIDAEEEDLQHWYIERFLNFWRAAPNNPHSFYRRFLHLDEEGVTALARSVWSGVNLPNLRENILPVKRKADIVIHKDRSHGLVLQRVP